MFVNKQTRNAERMTQLPQSISKLYEERYISFTFTDYYNYTDIELKICFKIIGAATQNLCKPVSR